MERREVVENLEAANLPTLLAVIYQLSGDKKWIEAPYLPKRSPGMDDLNSGGFDEPFQKEIREAAADVIMQWVEGRPIQVPNPDLEELHRVMQASMGEAVPVVFAEMMREQAGHFETGELENAKIPAAVRGGARVGIIGAGVSGLLAAKQFLDRGIEVIVFERQSDVGGCWIENSYPGCGVDTPSYLYSFSFYGRDWSNYFGKRDEVLNYIQDMATTQGLRSFIRFQSDVQSVKWTGTQWSLKVATPSGVVEESVEFLISAVGQLHVPSVPNFPGMNDFDGTVFHSARWPDDLELDGKRVVVVGSGASAMQIVPAVADRVESLTVMQRSRQWVAPNADYFQPIDSRVHWLMNKVPFYHFWSRSRLAWIHNDRVHVSLQIDPEWVSETPSINAINDGHRRYFTQYLLKELEGRPDLVEQTLPNYPPFGKRMLLDNGWYQALRKDNVRLVESGVSRFTAGGVVAEDGEEIKADIVVLATGFRAREFLVNIDVQGPNGALSEAWADEDARAYMGMSVPNFPNLFVMYGPNTNLGHGGSFITIAECQAHYLGELIDLAEREGISELSVREEVCERYNERVDEAHSKMIWSYPGMNTWYRNARGRVVSNSPWQVMDYWKMTRTPKLEEYDAKSLVRG